MSDLSLNSEIQSTAQGIGSPTTINGLHNSQLEYWLSIQSTMQHGGYEAVRKRFSLISEELALKISNASVKSLIQLCSAQISTIRPAIPDETIFEMLAPSHDVNAKAMMQILSESSAKGEHNV